MINHGQVLVNERHVDIPSYRVKPGDVVRLTEEAANMPIVQEEMSTRGVIASWLERDGPAGRIISIPRREDIEPDIREDLIVEFYAR
jgi:small subunit ribosomal protein S4